MQNSCSVLLEYPPNQQGDIYDSQPHSISVQQIQSLQPILFPSCPEAGIHDSYVRLDYGAPASVETLQQGLKSQVLRSMRVLREIVKDLGEFNLEVETINSWMTETEGVDTKQIPVESRTPLQVFISLVNLNHIFTECLTASGPERGSLLKDQALELLFYIQNYGEKCHLIKNPQIFCALVDGWKDFFEANMSSRLSDLFPSEKARIEHTLSITCCVVSRFSV